MRQLSGEITILHVDDDPDFIDLAAKFLERDDEDFTVVTATNVADGLSYVSEHDVDCIVSDYEMPDRDGIEFLKNVRESMPRLTRTGSAKF